ncbi:MAG: hypothetical protein HOP07_16605 [Bacteriovoracaceae bacterium]|nr:hypothetical protein [Bacteriovoracaceae bacterium]
MNLKTILMISFALQGAAAGCSGIKERTPSSVEIKPLSEILSELSDALVENKKNTQKCSEIFMSISNDLFMLSGEMSFNDYSDIPLIDKEIEKSFKARLALKDSIKDQPIATDCYNNKKMVFRSLKNIEDYLIGLRMEKSINPSEEYTKLSGEFPYLLINPKFITTYKSASDLKSGDILLSRESSHSQAFLSALAHGEHFYSQVSFIHQDPISKETNVSMAFPEIGSVTPSLNEVLDIKNIRTSVFRYNNGYTAHEASSLIFQKIVKQNLSKDYIPYDFAFDLKDESRLSSTEIISSGFKNNIPMFKSNVTSGIKPILEILGASGVEQILTPDDIQFDPRFELVAEWTNPRKIEENRFMDLILSKMFDRIIKGSYQFDLTTPIEGEAKKLWLLRKTSIVRKYIEDLHPITMNSKQVELFMNVDKVGEEIFKILEKRSLEFDRSMTLKEINLALDNIFEEDFQAYKSYIQGQDVVKPTFHLLFHP